jgi:carbon monoxide dehydrogenase subunit G
MRIEERFVVKAAAGEVWSFLVDPRRVVGCVPGGELEEVLDERTFRGQIRVKVGAVTLPYRGRVRLAEVDAAALRVKIVGEASEGTGTGSARLALQSWLVARPDGTTEVVALVEAEVVGRIVQFLRGMVEQFAHEVFRDFAACVRATIEAKANRPGVAGPSPRREPLRAIPLLLRALRSWIAGLVRPRGDGAPRA